MTHCISVREDLTFSPFEESLVDYSLPDRFTFPFDYKPHPLSLLAVEKLQLHLKNQKEWTHNFGLSDQDGTVIGKMFGVLVVMTDQGQTGYLSAFSGKLAGKNYHSKFVPPIFDGVESGGFLNTGMMELTRINEEIRTLEIQMPEAYQDRVFHLKTLRKTNSATLQEAIFDQYHFLNQAGQRKSLRAIFDQASYKNPPSGAGECAAPKLLQYAFQHRLKPIALAEFWWGLSPKSEFWKHGQFYPPCQEKCAPILAHMLGGMDVDEKPEV